MISLVQRIPRLITFPLPNLKNQPSLQKQSHAKIACTRKTQTKTKKFLSFSLINIAI